MRPTLETIGWAIEARWYHDYSVRRGARGKDAAICAKNWCRLVFGAHSNHKSAA